MAFGGWKVEELREYIYRAEKCGLDISDEHIEQEISAMINPYHPAFITEWDVLRKYEELHILSLREELAWYEEGCPMENINLADEVIIDDMDAEILFS